MSHSEHKSLGIDEITYRLLKPAERARKVIERYLPGLDVEVEEKNGRTEFFLWIPATQSVERKRYIQCIAERDGRCFFSVNPFGEEALFVHTPQSGKYPPSVPEWAKALPMETVFEFIIESYFFAPLFTRPDQTEQYPLSRGSSRSVKVLKRPFAAAPDKTTKVLRWKASSQIIDHSDFSTDKRLQQISDVVPSQDVKDPIVLRVGLVNVEDTRAVEGGDEKKTEALYAYFVVQGKFLTEESAQTKGEPYSEVRIFGRKIMLKSRITSEFDSALSAYWLSVHQALQGPYRGGLPGAGN